MRNQGAARSNSTTLRYYQSTDSTITTGDTEVGTDSVSGLTPSESGDESVSLNAPSTSGTYYYGACVDSVSDELRYDQQLLACGDRNGWRGSRARTSWWIRACGQRERSGGWGVASHWIRTGAQPGRGSF